MDKAESTFTQLNDKQLTSADYMAGFSWSLYTYHFSEFLTPREFLYMLRPTIVASIARMPEDTLTNEARIIVHGSTNNSLSRPHTDAAKRDYSTRANQDGKGIDSV